MDTVCENEGVGPNPSGHTNYLKLVLKIYLVTFEHEGVGLLIHATPLA